MCRCQLAGVLAIVVVLLLVRWPAGLRFPHSVHLVTCMQLHIYISIGMHRLSCL
jgi:hypothetical protein